MVFVNKWDDKMFLSDTKYLLGHRNNLMLFFTVGWTGTTSTLMLNIVLEGMGEGSTNLYLIVSTQAYYVLSYRKVERNL